jgi:hypothetical protein
MDDLMRVLGPVIACSIALQQFLELIDPALDRFIRPHKKWILSVISLAIALALTGGLGLGILAPLGYPGAGIFDVFVTALFMISGTKGANELLKWLGYRKTAARLALPEAEARTV